MLTLCVAVIGSSLWSAFRRWLSSDSRVGIGGRLALLWLEAEMCVRLPQEVVAESTLFTVDILGRHTSSSDRPNPVGHCARLPVKLSKQEWLVGVNIPGF